jgi:hypothetical protein
MFWSAQLETHPERFRRGGGLVSVGSNLAAPLIKAIFVADGPPIDSPSNCVNMLCICYLFAMILLPA